MPLPLRHPSSKRKAGAPDASELVLDAGFLAAYLQERRRQDPMAQEVRVYAVKDEGGNLVAFGLPCDWGDGVAEKVLIGDYSVETIGGFRGLDSRWASAPPQIISSNYKRRPFARSSGAEVEWKVDNAERKR